MFLLLLYIIFIHYNSDYVKKNRLLCTVQKENQHFMPLNSVSYAKLIAWLAFNKHHVTLGRTQIQKILFVCYGVYYANKDRLLFEDDAPQAWPFGPVFPISYKKYDSYISSDLTDEEKKEFLQDKNTLLMITKLTASLCFHSARDLTAWSHQIGSPWSKVVVQGGKVKWSAPLDKNDIKEYFKSGEWVKGLN